MTMLECPFCEIIMGIARAETVLWDNDNDVVFFRPLNPVAPGHLLAVPYRHVTDFAESPDVTESVMRACAEFVRPGDWNLITSKGRSATQTIFHLHVHLIPRSAGDGLTLPWTGQETTDDAT